MIRTLKKKNFLCFLFSRFDIKGHFMSVVYKVACVMQGQTSCHPKRRDRRRRSRFQHHKRRKHKRKRGEIFRVVRVSASNLPLNKRLPTVHQQSSPTQSLPYSHHSSWVPIHHKHKLERPQHSPDIASRGLPLQFQYDSKWYGRWSRWSPCSISCTTQRFRFVVASYALFPWVVFVTDMSLAGKSHVLGTVHFTSNGHLSLSHRLSGNVIKNRKRNYSFISYNICISADSEMDLNKATTEFNVILCFSRM